MTLAPSLRAQTAPSTPGAVVLRAARVIDGTGAVLRNQDVSVTGGRISAIKPSAGALPSGGIDLQGRTLMPGMIDTHVHLGWYLNAKNRLHTARDGDTPDISAYNQAANAWATLRAGFTTVQDVGEPENAALRDLNEAIRLDPKDPISFSRRRLMALR